MGLPGWARRGNFEAEAKPSVMFRFIMAVLAVVHMFFSFITHAQAPADTIRPGKGHLLTAELKPGLRQYLVTFQNPKQPRSLGFWYWLRDIRVIDHGGDKVFAITQHW